MLQLRLVCSLAAFLSFALSLYSQQSLPYEADFEASEGFTAGPLNKQFGWSVSAGEANIVFGPAQSGTQYVSFSPGVTAGVITKEFCSTATSPSIVYVDFYAKPAFGADTATGTLFDLDAASVVSLKNGTAGQIFALNGDGLGVGTWEPLAPVFLLDNVGVATQWQRLTVRLNYLTQTYDIYLNGVMFAANLRFRIAVAPYLSWFSVKGNTLAGASLDSLYVGAANPLFADSNNNGVDDAWETTHGLSLVGDSRSTDSDGDGLTDLQEYLAGSDPTDYYNSTLPVLAFEIDVSGVPGLNGLVSVKVTRGNDGGPLVNAPLILKVTSGASQIAASPSGMLASSILVHTDATGIASGYVKFSAQAADTLIATTVGGSRFASRSISLFPSMPTSGLRLWLRADSLSVADPISVWADQSGQGNDATQVIGASRPVLVENALNGRPVVRFDGNNDYLNLPDFMNANMAKGQTTAAAGDVFVVWKADRNPDGSSRANGMWSIGGDDRYTATDGQLYEGFGTTARYSTGVPVQPVNRYHMYSVSAQAGDWVNRIDGQIQHHSRSNTVGWSNAPTLGRSNYPPSGDIAEIVIYDRILTDIEREAVGRYLGCKYALYTVPTAPTNLTAIATGGTQI
ncbi:hypothetical protein DB347_20095, partial [Opitutaceae bacterium EW11]